MFSASNYLLIESRDASAGDGNNLLPDNLVSHHVVGPVEMEPGTSGQNILRTKRVFFLKHFVRIEEILKN